MKALNTTKYQKGTKHSTQKCGDVEILYQKEFKLTPKYLQLAIDGPPHNRIFTMGVLDKNGDIIARGTGKTKKEAEQEASRLALIYYDETFNVDSDSEIEL